VRLGRWSHVFFNSIRQIVGVEDPEYHFTGYEWCRCGDVRKIIDAAGNVTSWVHDAQGRVTSKTYPDLRGEVYIYGPLSGRLASTTDAKNQTTNFSYFLDNDLQQVSYTNAEHATASVSYTYDPNYNRIATMTD
jgi:YD repeat-containing protein